MAPRGGGSLLLAWQLKGKRVLIIGGGTVAHGRLLLVLETDAHITLIAPRSKLHPSIVALLHDPDTTSRLVHIDTKFRGEEDLIGVDLVLSAIDDNEVSQEIHKLCKQIGIPVNVADVPPLCDFYFGSMIRRGPLQIMVSTNGRGPKLANIIRTSIETSLPDNVEGAIEKVGILRNKLRQRAPGVGGSLGQKRMKWMIGVCDTWTLRELALMSEEMMDVLLDDGWEADGKVPTFDQVIGRSKAWNQWMKKCISPSIVFSLTLGIATGALASFAFLAPTRR